MKRLVAFFLVTFLPAAALADTAALVIGNRDYDRLPDVADADDVYDTRRALDRADVRVVAEEDATAARLFRAFEDFADLAPRSDRLLVVLSGRVVYSETDTYFLPVDQLPEPFTTLHRRSLPLSAVLALLADAPGEAILVVTDDNRRQDYGDYLSAGPGEIEVPQGVTLITGNAGRSADLIEDYIARPGRPFERSARERGLSVTGYRPEDRAFLPAPERLTTDGVERRPEPAISGLERLNDIRSWRVADGANTVEAYRDYLRNFPNGQFRAMAENRIRALTDTPEARAERAEQSLDLNREARRSIQRDLSLLQYDTRGIDGIFGAGTRRAIASWQGDNGLTRTGFLDRSQIDRLNRQAQQRAAELEAEAERRRQQLSAQDRAFWDETGGRQTESGYRRYLERYPDGEFADVAEDRLARIEAEKGRQADVRDRNFWNRAKEADTIDAYRAYLVQSQDGAFQDEARARIAELERQDANRERRQAARAEEEALGLSSAQRRLIEARLAAMDLNPGEVDGEFDRRTRRALRRYQEARNLPVTGFVDQGMIVRLLAEALGRR